MTPRSWASTLIWLAVWLSGARAFAASPSDFLITGTVVSTRDGSPVPFCRISAGPAGPTVTAPSSSPRNPDAPRFGRGQPGGPAGRQPPPGRPGGPARVTHAIDLSPETRADASGHFSLPLPHGGSWRLTAAARGFRTQAYDEHEGFYSSVVLSNVAPTYELAFRLTPDAIINGLVIDEAGEPVTSAQIIAELVPPLVAGESRASSSARPIQVANAQTDDRGRYELPGLQPGQYHLRLQAQPWYAASARGGGFRGGGLTSGGRLQEFGGPSPAPNPDPSLDMVYATTWFPGADSEDGAEPISLAAGEERQADFHLAPLPAAHLVISRPDAAQPEENDGRPRQARPVTLSRVASDGAYGQTTFIGGNGREWDFGGLAPGTYEVRLPGQRGDQDGETRQIEVRPGSSGVLTLENSKPLTRVTVKIDGLSESSVSSVEFFDTETGRRIIASSPPRGRRGRRGDNQEEEPADDPAANAISVMLPPHRYEITMTGSSSAYILGLTAAGAKVVGRTVEIGSDPATLSLHLANGRAELSGFVVRDTKPASGALVLLVPATLGQLGDLTPIVRDQTNTDGSFLLQSVVPGRYILVAIDHGWHIDWRDAQTLSKFLLKGTPVDLKPSAKLREQIPAVEP